MKTTRMSRCAIIGAASIVIATAVFTKTRDHVPPVNTAVEEHKDASLEHRREVYIHALEWCESRGYNNAINEMDRDGTASYYNFQWKPSTFKYYSVKYKVLSADLEEADYFNWMGDYEMQHSILKKMLDDPKVVWQNEFPDCVNKKVGRPPMK